MAPFIYQHAAQERFLGDVMYELTPLARLGLTLPTPDMFEKKYRSSI